MWKKKYIVDIFVVIPVSERETEKNFLQLHDSVHFQCQTFQL